MEERLLQTVKLQDDNSVRQSNISKCLQEKGSQERSNSPYTVGFGA